MEPSEHRRRAVRRLALWCALLVLLITSLSAYIRLSQAGGGCTPWPACFGGVLRAAQRGQMLAAGDTGAVQLARLAHRVIATVALAGLLALLALCLIGRPRLWRSGALAGAAFLLALGLAVLGAWMRSSPLPVVAVGNLLGGMLMFALCWRLAAPAEARSRSAASTGAGTHGYRGTPAFSSGGTSASTRLLAWLVLLVLLLQIGLGGLTSASYAGQSCLGLLDCVRGVDAAHWPWGVLDPWREPRWDPGLLPLNAAAAPVQLLHRLGAALLVLLGILLAWQLRRGGRQRAAVLLLVLLSLQLALGVLLVGSHLALVLALCHNLVAAALLALVIRTI